MGSRGTAKERAAEAAKAARILGVERTNLRLPDGQLNRDPAATTRAIVEVIRRERPRAVLTHCHGDHHPDHDSLSRATKDAFFLANVLKYETGQERHRPLRLFYYWGHRFRFPERLSFIADVSDQWEVKVAALRAHASQFHNPAYKGPETFVSSEAAWQLIENRSRYFGSLIGVQHGEAYIAEDALRVDDPLSLPDW